jgi:hypothetical protein
MDWRGGLCGVSVALGLCAVLAAPAPAATPASFGDAAIGLEWRLEGASLRDVAIADRLNGARIEVEAPFAVKLADGRTLAASDFILAAAPTLGALPGDLSAARLSERGPRATLSARFEDAEGRFRVDWRLMQPEGAAWLREEITITALKQDEAIARIDLMQSKAPDGAEVVGKTAGSPVVAGRDFLQFEHPLSDSSVGIGDGRIRLWITRALPLLKGQSVTYSAAVGATRPGQLRRDFAAYVEAERAHPYRSFLTYNSWYDIGYFTPYTQAQALDRIQAFGTELVQKRGVKLDSFLFDDGWDDRSGSWGFSKDFPDGFSPLRDAAARYGAAPGVWLSPWGGYGKPKRERVAAGQAEGFEIVDGGFALSGPRYLERFRAATLDLLEKQGVNQFKLDGTGNADRVVPGSAFDSDFAAAISLIADLRRAKPDLFVNLTTGTYPSPAWLRYADSIWRDGEDHDFAGVGSSRERWITYRDRETYENVVVKGPLFPLNALMLHGVIYAQQAEELGSDPGHDFANEVRSYFGSGVGLQEMYVTPSLLTPGDWDVLAEAARWSRANVEVLKDSHWIGGDPGRLDVYGWAAWSPKKAIITLRNPDAVPRALLLDVGRALELPAGAARIWRAKSPWASDRAAPARTFEAGRTVEVSLQPFQVLTLELAPAT